MGRSETVGVIITFVSDAAFISVCYISEANWKFPPWGHRRMLPVVLAWAGCGFPTGVQDVNRADRLPVILQEMRGWGFCGKKGVRSFQHAAGTFFRTSQVHQNHLEGWQICGEMLWVYACWNVRSHPDPATYSGSVEMKMRSLGKKGEVRRQKSSFSAKKHHHSRTTSTLHVFRAVTQTACSGKMFHWNLTGHLLPWALTCVCLCVCVCLAGAHQTHAGVSLAEV